MATIFRHGPKRYKDKQPRWEVYWVDPVSARHRGDTLRSEAAALRRKAEVEYRCARHEVGLAERRVGAAEAAVLDAIERSAAEIADLAGHLVLGWGSAEQAAAIARQLAQRVKSVRPGRWPRATGNALRRTGSLRRRHRAPAIEAAARGRCRVSYLAFHESECLEVRPVTTTITFLQSDTAVSFAEVSQAMGEYAAARRHLRSAEFDLEMATKAIQETSKELRS